MYPHEDGLTTNSSRVDARDPDTVKFPLFERTRGYQCIIRPGEALYLPPGTDPRVLPAHCQPCHLCPTTWFVPTCFVECTLLCVHPSLPPCDPQHSGCTVSQSPLRHDGPFRALRPPLFVGSATAAPSRNCVSVAQTRYAYPRHSAGMHASPCESSAPGSRFRLYNHVSSFPSSLLVLPPIQ